MGFACCGACVELGITTWIGPKPALPLPSGQPELILNGTLNNGTDPALPQLPQSEPLLCESSERLRTEGAEPYGCVCESAVCMQKIPSPEWEELGVGATEPPKMVPPLLPLVSSAATGTSVPRDTDSRTSPFATHFEGSGAQALPHSGGGASPSNRIRRGAEHPAVLLMTR